MSGCQLAESRIHGFPSVVLSSDWLSLTLVPHLGGKLMSLYDRKHQYEWLWTNPLLAHLRPLSTAPTEEQLALGGWDECFPGLRAGRYPFPPWTGFDIPRRGDLWAHNWKQTVVENGAGRVALRMSTEGDDLPYRFERTITLQAGEPVVELSYRLCNASHVPMPYVWSSYPLLRTEAGMRVVLPAHTRVWVDHALPAGTIDAGAVMAWPRLAVRQHVRDLSVVLPESEGWAVKLYTVGLGTGPVAVEHPSLGRRLDFDFELDSVPNVGLWLNYGGWGGRDVRPAYHLGVMPCAGGADDLQVAVQRGQYAVLPAAGEQAWTLKLTLA